MLIGSQSDAVARVVQVNASKQVGVLTYGQLRLRCAVGRAGVRPLKREGDAATPLGVWPLRQLLYRADKVRRPRAALPIEPIEPADGWCDAQNDRNYNRLVSLPYPASAEELWRGDDLYDIVVVLGYNDEPRVRGRGSAIFMHVARHDFAPTAGCLALRRSDLLLLLESPQPPRWIDTRPHALAQRTRRGFM